MVFVPTEDLSVLDPHLAGPRSRRNHAYVVFDTLHGLDASWTAQPQMERLGRFFGLIDRSLLHTNPYDPRRWARRGVWLAE